MSERPIVIAHRGSSGWRPENTLAALEEVLDLVRSASRPVGLHLELKASDPAREAAVLRTLGSDALPGTVTLQSFDTEVLARLAGKTSVPLLRLISDENPSEPDGCVAAIGPASTVS